VAERLRVSGQVGADPSCSRIFLPFGLNM